MYITNQNIADLIRGASIFACGGGLAVEEQMLDIKKLPTGFKVKLVSLGDLPDNAPLTTISELGPADQPPLPKEVLPKLVQVLVNKKGLTSPAALLPRELGQESITVMAAQVLGLPIVDTDTAGQRAVPSSEFNLVNLFGDLKTTYSAVAINSHGKVIEFHDLATASLMEKELRKFAIKSKGVILVVRDYQTVKQVKSILKHKSYSQALETGKLGPSSLKDRLQLDMEIEIVKIKPKPIVGFHGCAIAAQDKTGNSLEITCLNEYLSLNISGEKYKFPDLICLTLIDGSRGVACSQVKPGQKYRLLVVTAIDTWMRAKTRLPNSALEVASLL